MKSAWQIEALEKYREERRRERFAESLTTETPVVPLRLCRCPRCRSSDCKTTRTIESSADIVRQRKHCNACGCAFVAVAD